MNIAVDILLEVEGGEQKIGRVGSGGLRDPCPGLALAPPGIARQESLLSRAIPHFRCGAPGIHDEAAHAGIGVIEALADQRQGPVLRRFLKVGRKRRKGLIAGHAATVPVLEGRNGARQVVGELGAVHGVAQEHADWE